MSEYAEGGVALFYCPDLWELYGQRCLGELSWRERMKVASDAEGHMEWSFSWGAGSYHIDHDNNGGVPRCYCGKQLVFVAGNDPGHRGGRMRAGLCSRQAALA